MMNAFKQWLDITRRQCSGTESAVGGGLLAGCTGYEAGISATIEARTTADRELFDRQRVADIITGDA